MKIRVVVTGRSYHAAEPIPDEIVLPDDATVDDAIQSISEFLPSGEQLPASCLVAVAGNHIGTLASRPNQPLRDGDELTLIAPVAGG